jgi:metal-responsive CopG/Arc/MetJ family transcriptional regulator
MQRVTITIDDDLVAEIDAFMTGHGCADRSKAIGDLAGRASRNQTSKRRIALAPGPRAISMITRTANRPNA